MRTHTKEFQQSLTPRTAFEVLVDGNKRFVKNLKMNRNLLEQMNDTAGGQFPFAVALSCMDSRTSIELIFDQGLGEIFSLRVAGNVVNDDIVGSLEYACKVAGAKVIVVLGHTRCGAIRGACDHVELGHLSALLSKVDAAIEKTKAARGAVSDETYVELVSQANVLNSMDQILASSDILRDMLQEGKIGMVGGMYSVETGSVSFTKQVFNEQAATMQRSNQLSVSQ